MDLCVRVSASMCSFVDVTLRLRVLLLLSVIVRLCQFCVVLGCVVMLRHCFVLAFRASSVCVVLYHVFSCYFCSFVICRTKCTKLSDGLQSV